ncbi:hypothetical protein [Stackebrandtia soli]|uniref:hypothetical protein n=1 Tax=Stackebrandtia soli TaxID=1892856 RepID=UPI0039ED49FB
MYEGSWWTATGHDRYQNEAIESLASSVSRQTRSLSRQLRDARSTSKQLSTELSAVSERLNSFMEYVELRFDLLVFDDELAVHNAIGRSFAALASGVADVKADFADIPEYWLPPAARDVLARLGGAPVDPGWFESAVGRDPVRSRLFLLSAGHGFERRELTSGPARDLLLAHPSLLDRDPSGIDRASVSTAWRSLWLASASGAHGPEAFATLLERLTEASDSATVKQWRTWLVPDEDRPTAAQALRALRTRCEQILDAPVRDDSGSDIDAWRSYMEELAAEGSAAARPVFERAKHHRDRLDGLDEKVYPAWRRPIGDIDDLIREDLLSEDAPTPARVVALRASVSTLRNVAAELFEESRRPMALSRDIRSHGKTLTVTRDGVSERDLIAHDNHIEGLFPAVRNSGGLLLIGSAVALLVALGLIWSNVLGFGVTLGLGALIAGGIGVSEFREVRINRGDVRTAKERTRSLVASTVEQIVGDAHIHVQEQARARADHDVIVARLDQIESAGAV